MSSLLNPTPEWEHLPRFSLKLLRRTLHPEPPLTHNCHYFDAVHDTMLTQKEIFGASFSCCLILLFAVSRLKKGNRKRKTN